VTPEFDIRSCTVGVEIFSGVTSGTFIGGGAARHCGDQ